MEDDEDDGTSGPLIASAASFRRTFESIGIADLVTDASMDLLASGGPARLTLGAIAKAVCLPPSSLHFKTGGLAPLLATVVETFAWRWNRWATNPYAGEGLIRFPRGEAARDAARVGFALAEVAAGEERAGHTSAMVELRRLIEDEHDALAYRLARAQGTRPAPVVVDLCLAAALGLRMLTTHQLADIGESEADEVVRLLDALLAGGAGSSTE